MSRPIIEHVLFDAGHEVETTDNEAGGRDLLDRRSYDLVLADGRPEDGTGMEVADQAWSLGCQPSS